MQFMFNCYNEANSVLNILIKIIIYLLVYNKRIKIFLKKWNERNNFRQLYDATHTFRMSLNTASNMM